MSDLKHPQKHQLLVKVRPESKGGLGTPTNLQHICKLHTQMEKWFAVHTAVSCTMPVHGLFQSWCFSLVFLPRKWGSTRQASLPVPAEAQPWPGSSQGHAWLLSCPAQLWGVEGLECSATSFQLQHCLCQVKGQQSQRPTDFPVLSPATFHVPRIWNQTGQSWALTPC